jgi:hypothetical protein
MTFNQGTWARDLLERMHYPVSEDNMAALLAWQYAEGGHFNNSAHFNPLNTSKTWPGAESMNSHGVKAYDSYADGMDATVATLNLDYYKDVRAALKEGDSARAVLGAVVASPWGTTSLAYATLSRAREELRQHPQWIRGSRRPGRPPQAEFEGPEESVIVYPAELDSLITLLTERVGEVQRADQVGREVWADLHLSPVVDPTEAPLDKVVLPGVDRERLHRAARELGMSLDDNLGLPFVDRQLGRARDYVQRFVDRIREIDGDGYRPRTRAEALRMLRALKGKLDPVGYGVMQAFLLGGLRTGRPPARRPTAPHRQRPERPRSPHRPEHGARHQRVERMINRAESQLGYRETGSNYTKYGTWYGMPGQPWCAMFVSWVFAKSGQPLPAIQGPRGFAGTDYAIGELRPRGDLHRTPKPGDVFIYPKGPGYTGHTGIVTDVNPNGTFDTIEGNAGSGSTSVVRDSRSPNDGKGYVFWSPIK